MQNCPKSVFNSLESGFTLKLNCPADPQSTTADAEVKGALAASASQSSGEEDQGSAKQRATGEIDERGQGHCNTVTALPHSMISGPN